MTTTTPILTVPSGGSRLRPGVLGVVGHPLTYRSIAYLLLGLPLGTLWFAIVVTGLSVGVSMLVVALLGIPLLVGLGHLTRAMANVERRTVEALLGGRLPQVPMEAPSGNLWDQLRAMCADRRRRRELGYLVLRFPVGIATFTVAVTALAAPVLVATAPMTARWGGRHPFGDAAVSSTIEDVASSSPWAWLLVPLGLALLVAALHLLHALADACGRWATASLGR